MGVSVIQPSFAAGEMSPTLASRADLARYLIGLKTCRNFTVMQHGGIQNRPGTIFVDSTPGDLPVKLVRFKFSIADSCLLVFGANTMRVVRNGTYVLNGSGSIYSIATPWSASDLAELSYTQSADVMTFVHSGHRPRELKRFANNNWTITEPTYVPTIQPPTAITVAVPPDGSGVQKLIRYQVTAVVDDAFSIEESLPVTSPSITAYNSAGYEVNLTWPLVSGATYYNVYKDDTVSGVYGFAGRATNGEFTDRNIVQTKTDVPPTGLDPFVGTGNYPSAVGYYQQRKVYGGSLNKPQTIYFSRTGQFNNYGYSLPSKDDDAITWTMASTEVNRVLSFLPLRNSLMVFTNGAEWSIQGGTSGLTSKTIMGAPQSYNGSGFVQPLVLNDTALYLQNRGQQVSGLNYSLESDGVASEDLLVYSSHLTRDYNITNWTYQRLPDSIVWSVRSDGTLLGMTYLRRQDVIAWHRHDTDGAVESVCCIPEGDDDVLYLVVRRVIAGATKRYIERMASRNIPLIAGTTERDNAMSMFVDCGLTYNGWNMTNATVSLSGGTNWLAQEPLTLTGAGTNFTAAMVGRQIAIRAPDDLEVYYFDIVSRASATSLVVSPAAMVPESIRNLSSTNWALCARTLSGLSHLEGKQVAILADGNVIADNLTGNYTVSGGSITLQDYAAVVHIGLPYVSDAETLRINVSGQETLNDKLKTVNSVTLVVHESRGIFAGRDADNLFEFKQRYEEFYNSPVDLLTGMAKVAITNTWDGQGQVFIRQADPLPLTILGIIPELTIAGKA